MKVIDDFFPRLNNQSIIVFQDFFLPWSAGNIACIYIMIKLGYFKIINSFASSLVLKNEKKINIKKLKKNILDSTKDNCYHTNIEKIKPFFNEKNTDRFYYFYPRLILAQIQNCYQINDQEQLTIYFNELINNKKFINMLTLNDLNHLIKLKFNPSNA